VTKAPDHLDPTGNGSTPGSAADRWNDRYRARGPIDDPPAAMLDEVAALLPATGSVVDIAGGDGRNARWFAARGYQVTIIDVSAVALGQAQEQLRSVGVEPECIERDLEVDAMPEGRRWDIAFVHLYHDPALLRALPDHLEPGGVLVFAQPTVTNLERHGQPSARFLLEVGEIERLAEAVARDQTMEILRVDAAWRASGRHAGWLVARRR
jgi:tellurite methyltransferase